MIRTISAVIAGAWALGASSLVGQEQRALQPMETAVGLGIGDVPRVVGLRLNFRDRNLYEVVGANVTVWTPHEPTGVVRGLALGVPATGARQIDGVGVALLGLGTSESMRGIAAGGLGLGTGRDLTGIAVGGLGLGVGRDLTGLSAGGLGIGVGNNLHGAAVGGLGVGVGDNARGIVIGGLGSGVGEDATGIVLGGIGAGVGGDATGIFVGGVGVGIGGDLRGISLAAVGTGVGGTLRGVSLAGIGIGAGAIEGIAVASAVGTGRSRGLVIAPAYFRIADDGTASGVNVSAFNDVRGTQRGLAVGIFNYARHLEGVQLGLLNYAGNKSPGTRLLPIINVARGR
jgi:hypothetical protein